jgi:HK97 gp10 family phage protein
VALSIMEAIARFSIMAAEAEVARHEGLKHAAEIVEKEAKALIGTYDAGWVQLSQETQESRSKAGHSPNDPLLVQGDLRDSIGHHVEGDKAVVGSNSQIAVYQELGTDHIPARSFLGAAAHRKAEEVARKMGITVIESIVRKKV